MIDALRNYGESQLSAKLEAKYSPSELIMSHVTRIYNAVQHGVTIELKMSVPVSYMTSH